ncbi:MAG: metalloprotease TldD, partial [Pusillimonas sp.]|nr:metalloprotease TldD [Pusillimonas sp.]
MKVADPGIEALATAKSLLLDPWELNEAHMSRALGEIFTRQVDYADLYFQYTRSEGWSLEEGIVKTGSFSISQGVGVRAISGDKTAFAYSDSLSPEALLSSAKAVKSIGRKGNGSQSMNAGLIAPSSSLYPFIDPVNTLPAPEKVALLERVEA